MLTEERQRKGEEAIRRLASHDYSVAEARQIQDEFGETVGGIILASALLQKKANAKLGEGTWWVTEKSLQQATPWQVAAAKASWFGDQRDDRIHDLCCGLGGDSVHLAKIGSVVSTDTAEEMCLIAAANLRNTLNNQFQFEQVRLADAADCQVDPSHWLHIDPDRRAKDQRTTDPNYYSPDWSTVIRLAQHSRGALIKLAPAAEMDEITLTPAHRVWISLRGIVREQSLLTGEVYENFARIHGKSLQRHQRSALILNHNSEQRVFTGGKDTSAPIAKQPLALIIDPDPAVRAAGLTERFAERYSLQMLGGPSGFLTGHDVDHSILDFAVCERVLWSGACDDRKLRRELRARNLYPSRVKTRGVPQNPNQLEKRLRKCGDVPTTLWIGRKGKGQFATFTQRLELREVEP